MKRFDILSCLGDYLSSTIYKAKNKETGEIITLKLLKKKFYTWEEWYYNLIFYQKNKFIINIIKYN